MPAGLEIYDRFGNLRVSYSDRLFRFLGDPLIVGPGGSGVVTNDGFLTGAPDFIANVFSPDGTSYWPGEGLLPPDVTFSDNQMFYSVPSYLPTQIIQYGVS
ncbi:hypothetical protein [Bosea minatitlanensis]|uniref:Uncharacterized protein n=1 Tax=Bosea minatitlanensis TaxID=128782 RepID=A0ABW0F138_9HYPH|nr:hypothetical protein [Bosea minatitlanensis]MCT4492699.1 hypothetical protein [Bosea minatitlanensis]